MTVRTLGILLLKLWGLISLLGGLISLASFALLLAVAPDTGDPGMNRYMHMTTALGAVVVVAFGTILLLGARRIVSIIYPGTDADAAAVPERYTPAELQSVAFGAVGAYLAISALRDIAELVYTIARQPDWDTTGQLTYMMERRQEDLAGAAVQLVLAVVLLFSRSALASAWSRARPMTRDESDTAGGVS
ncbi:MAG TPA: hypothetical protein VE974_15270 [Thermoanaerobaculia bacterium]|nr:hypothetical protein [Thermoanaerobaculia bacterium]